IWLHLVRLSSIVAMPDDLTSASSCGQVLGTEHLVPQRCTSDRGRPGRWLISMIVASRGPSVFLGRSMSSIHLPRGLSRWRFSLSGLFLFMLSISAGLA